MRNCGNIRLRRRAVTGVLTVMLAVGISACGGAAVSDRQSMETAQSTEAGAGASGQSANGAGSGLQQAAPDWNDMQPERSMELSRSVPLGVP